MSRSVEERLSDLERDRRFAWDNISDVVGYTFGLALIAVIIIAAAAASLVLIHWVLRTWGVVA